MRLCAGSIATFWVFICVAIIAFLFPSTDPRIVFNPTASAPRGWYWVQHRTVLQVGDYVVAELPADAAALADQRHYLPRNVPLLKRIGASFGQQICIVDGAVYIDNVRVAAVLQSDFSGRPLHAWTQCSTLRINEFFLFNPQLATSFDSRYFGPIDRVAVHGRAIPLWTWSAP